MKPSENGNLMKHSAFSSAQLGVRDVMKQRYCTQGFDRYAGSTSDNPREM